MFKLPCSSWQLLTSNTMPEPRLKTGLPHKGGPLGSMWFYRRPKTFIDSDVCKLMAEHFIKKLFVCAGKQWV